jgi:hypothetical protein
VLCPYPWGENKRLTNMIARTSSARDHNSARSQGKTANRKSEPMTSDITDIVTRQAFTFRFAFAIFELSARPHCSGRSSLLPTRADLLATKVPGGRSYELDRHEVYPRTCADMFVSGSGASAAHFDLEGMLRDPAALQELKIAYLPPCHENCQRFYVYGDGSLIWQGVPDRPMAPTVVPTCRSKVSTDTVKDLVRLIMEKHFFDLPERQFLMLYIGQGKEELEFHSISIDDGVGTARRTFAIGEFAGKRESLPPDFLSIQNELQRLKESAFPHSKITCHFAPAITIRN